MHLCNFEGVQEKELIPGIIAETNVDGDAYFNSIISQLKSKGYILCDTILSYYSTEVDGFIFCAIEPIKTSAIIPAAEVVKDKLILRAKVSPETTARAITTMPIERKTKKRKIGNIIEKLKIWRSYHQGYANNYGKIVKLSLDEAAERVGLPKKSLDDYLLQMKLGKKIGRAHV